MPRNLTNSLAAFAAIILAFSSISAITAIPPAHAASAMDTTFIAELA